MNEQVLAAITCCPGITDSQLQDAFGFADIVDVYAITRPLRVAGLIRRLGFFGWVTT